MSAFLEVDFQISSNADWDDIVAVFDGAGEPLSLAGATLSMAVETAAGVEQLALSTGNGRLIVDAEQPTAVRISVPAAVIKPLAPGAYVHDLLLTDAGGTTLIWRGSLQIVKGVTAWPS